VPVARAVSDAQAPLLPVGREERGADPNLKACRFSSVVFRLSVDAEDGVLITEHLIAVLDLQEDPSTLPENSLHARADKVTVFAVVGLSNQRGGLTRQECTVVFQVSHRGDHTLRLSGSRAVRIRPGVTSLPAPDL
jgi:hypothetical protein